MEQLTACLLCGSTNLAEDHFAGRMQNLAQGIGVTHEDTVRVPVYRAKLRRLQRHGAQGCLLDIGACSGVFLNEARQFGFEVAGIEPGVENCQRAQRQFDLTLHCGTVEEVDLAPESVDVLFSNHVFEHILDPLAALRRAVQWLRPGGLLMIEVPNQFSTFGVKRRRLRNKPVVRTRTFRSIHHPVFFSPATLRQLGRRCGCEVLGVRNVYYSRINLFRQPKTAVSRLLARLFGGDNIELLARKQ